MKFSQSIIEALLKGHRLEELKNLTPEQAMLLGLQVKQYENEVKGLNVKC